MASSMDKMNGAANSSSSRVQYRPLQMGLGNVMTTKVQPKISRWPEPIELWSSDNHVSLKNPEWIQENLAEMDHNVKQMVKLIEEEDVDPSTRKKAGRYNQKKPELIHLLDQLSSIYRPLADLLAQGSGGLILPHLPQLPLGNSIDESSYLQYSQSESENDELKILTLEEELKSTKEKLQDSEKEFGKLIQELKKSQGSEQALRSQLETVRDQALELADRDQEIRRQKEEITNAEKRHHQEEMMKLEKERSYLEKIVNELEVRCRSLEDEVTEKSVLEASLREEIRQLKDQITNADKSLSQVNTDHQEEMTKLEKEKSYLEIKVNELDVWCQALEEDVRQLQTDKSGLEASLRAEIEQMQTTVSQKIDQLDKITQDYSRVMNEKDQLNTRVEAFVVEMGSKDDHLKGIHLECVKMTEEMRGEREIVEKLREKVEELEDKVAKQEEILAEWAEEKREAIRQLCFSLEHYRVGYEELRESILCHNKKFSAMAF